MNEDVIYKNQSYVKIRLDTNTDLTDMTAAVIKYKKPSGTTGSWNATQDETYDTRIYVDVASTDTLDESGLWSFWSYVTFSGGRVAPGRVHQEYIRVEGN